MLFFKTEQALNKIFLVDYDDSLPELADTFVARDLNNRVLTLVPSTKIEIYREVERQNLDI